MHFCPLLFWWNKTKLGIKCICQSIQCNTEFHIIKLECENGKYNQWIYESSSNLSEISVNVEFGVQRSCLLLYRANLKNKYYYIPIKLGVFICKHYETIASHLSNVRSKIERKRSLVFKIFIVTSKRKQVNNLLNYTKKNLMYELWNFNRDN